ncbi:N-acetylmuramoyl-L-alanine amidase family protein [Pseudobutyrivibrio sp.]|uniref:N-acetylmuramoyl-L-alanine amidase family protein n=1 Tax=Pseudobutyrivibrio sp. TaxID=2014367 RepID=UPI001B74C097|nr:N-acetylmuramoyl-L-alanine amidase [Pseudobutyrivibrio sp.]MBP3261303.1 N-acetylmuramoyl-L-alanine amidase [Pseudobutyrivibrio sp.]
MEQKVMGAFTAIILAVVIIMSCILIYVPNMHIIALRIQDSKLSGGRVSVMDMLRASDLELRGEGEETRESVLKGHQIRLALPENVTSASVSIEDIYVDKTIAISINGIGKDYFEKYPMRGESNNIIDITYDSENLVGVIEITLDKVLEAQMTSEGEYIYVDFVDPHQVYDKIVVVDAGHGGNVPGATKMGVYEKDINLDIVLELKKLFDRSDKNIGVYYTRTDDSNPSFENRVGLANDSNADIFISVHNNSTASGRMSSINGCEVMYEGGDPTGESKKLAEVCLNHLLKELGAKSKGTVVGDEVYIIRMSQSPVALVEVGFMTNQRELENLQDKEYQRKAALAIYEAVLEYLNED